jgi:hypothetical protein
MPKTFPRFETGPRGDRAEAFVSPLPDVVVGLLADTPELKRHGDLARHFERRRAEAIALAAELEAAHREDEQRRRSALARGRKTPAVKADGVAAELETARSDTSALAEMLRESADELLAASVAVLPEAKVRATKARDDALAEAETLAAAVVAALDRADEAAAETGWVAGLLGSGRCFPYRAGQRASASRDASSAARSLPALLAEDRARQMEQREAAERERQHEETLKLPPGSTIWRGGETLVVGPSGVVGDEADALTFQRAEVGTDLEPVFDDDEDERGRERSA